MRIHPDRQTLILAGEPLPRRNAVSAANSSNSQRLNSLSTRFGSVVTDAEVTDAEYTPSTSGTDTNIVAYEPSDVSTDSSLPATTSRTSTVTTSRPYSSYAASGRGSAFGGANAYARTQDLSERHPIIDTYA